MSLPFAILSFVLVFAALPAAGEATPFCEHPVLALGNAVPVCEGAIAPLAWSKDGSDRWYCCMSLPVCSSEQMEQAGLAAVADAFDFDMGLGVQLDPIGGEACILPPPLTRFDAVEPIGLMAAIELRLDAIPDFDFGTEEAIGVKRNRVQHVGGFDTHRLFSKRNAIIFGINMALGGFDIHTTPLGKELRRDLVATDPNGDQHFRTYYVVEGNKLNPFITKGTGSAYAGQALAVGGTILIGHFLEKLRWRPLQFMGTGVKFVVGGSSLVHGFRNLNLRDQPPPVLPLQ